MNRPWSRSEKWLFATPLLVTFAGLALAAAPEAGRRARGYPKVLPVDPHSSVTSIAVSRDGRLLAVGTQVRGRFGPKTNTIELWDAKTFQRLPAPARPVKSVYNSRTKKTIPDRSTFGVAFSPQDNVLAWNSYATGYTFNDLKTKRRLWSRPASTIVNAAFSRQGHRVAVGDDGALHILDARTGKRVKS
ncbi:WD40 repeat domain-containing protein, partial [bacterium]